MSDNLPHNKKLVPIGEAAKMLGVSIDTIRRWDKEGRLTSTRPDGKTRHFAEEDLHKHKLSKKLTISQASKQLKISQSTLRRLEEKGLVKPERKKNGERQYDPKVIEDLLHSNSFFVKKQADVEIPAIGEKEKEHDESKTPEAATGHHEAKIPASNEEKQTVQNSRFRISLFITTSTLAFLILVSLGVRNISSYGFNRFQTISISEVLSAETQQSPTLTPTQVQKNDQIKSEVTPEATSSAMPAKASEVHVNQQVEPKPLIKVKLDEGALTVNIREKPSTDSGKIGKALNGDTFETISKDEEWYEVKLTDGQVGFISAQYIETNNL